MLGHWTMHLMDKTAGTFLSNSHLKFIAWSLQYIFIEHLLSLRHTVLGTEDKMKRKLNGAHIEERKCSMILLTDIFSLSSEKHGMFRTPQQVLTPRPDPTWIFCHLLEHILLVVLSQPRTHVLLLVGLISPPSQWLNFSNFSEGSLSSTNRKIHLVFLCS